MNSKFYNLFQKIIFTKFMHFAMFSMVAVMFSITQNANGQCTSITTLNQGGNGCGGGNMFDIIPTKDIRIDSFAARFNATGSQPAAIYFKTGTFSGFETVSAAWTLVGSTTVNVASTTVLTNIDVGNPIMLQANQTYGIYVNFNASYTNGSNTYSNADMTINTGTGLCNLFGGTNFGRVFNGTVYYCVSNPAPNNAAVTKIDSPSTYCPGLHNVVATIQNSGNNILDSVRVNWTFNGVQKPTIFHTTPLDTFGGTGPTSATLVLGNENFIRGQSYTIKVWTSHPNGGLDTINNNDTLSVTITNDPSCPYPNDAGIARIDSPKVYCPGLHNVVATLRNHGSNVMDSVRIHWTFNGVQKPTIFYNTPLGVSDSVSVVLGNENFAGGVSYDIKAWTSLPNGIQDSVNANDTSSVTVTHQPSCVLKKDVGVVSFLAPATSGCGFSTQTQVCVRITNYGSEPQFDIPVSFRIFFTVVATEIVTDTILPGATLDYCFNTTVDLTLPALYPFRAWTDLPGEMKRSNDTVPLNYPVITSSIRSNYPYLVTFENNPGAPPFGWINDPTNTENWNFNRTGPTVPSNVPFDNTLGNASGHYAWVDDTGPHRPNINLLTPCLDFTNLPKPYLEFYMYSSDTAFSSTMTLFVEVFDNNQWNTVGGPFRSTKPSEWQLKEVNLINYANKTVRVRFRANEVGTSGERDFAIDDVKFFNLGPINLHVTELIAPQSECDLTDIEPVTIAIRQKGSQPLLPGVTSIDVSFQVNNGFIVNETFVLTDTLFNDSIVHFTFNAPADLSAAGTYGIKAWAKHPLDDDYTNDTILRAVSDYLISSFPHSENFESFIITEDARGYENFWRSSPSGDMSKFRWNVMSGFTPTANTGPLGDHTSIDGNYIYTEANGGVAGDEAYVYTPCFDLGLLNNPGVNFWYNMVGSDVGELHLDAIISDTIIFLDVMPPIIGEQGQDWQLGVANLNNFTNEVVSFRFRAIKGSGVLGDIAIDDFKVGEIPIIGLGDTIRDCGMAILDAGINTTSYNWSTGGTTRYEVVPGSPTNTVSQEVTLIVTNASGMSNIDRVVVQLAPGPIVNLGPDILECDSNSVTLNAGNPGMNYLWNNGTLTQTRTVTTSGTYYVAVSNGLCTKTDTINVTFGPGHPTGSFTYSIDGNQIFFNSSIAGNVDSFFWDFGNNYFSYNANPNHYYLDSGDFVVKLIVMNECGSDTITQTVTPFGVGIQDFTSVASLEVSPNPNNGLFNISMNTKNVSEMEISIMNVNGQLIEKREYETISNKFNESFDLLHLSKGVYFLKINTKKDVITRKIIIQ